MSAGPSCLLVLSATVLAGCKPAPEIAESPPAAVSAVMSAAETTAPSESEIAFTEDPLQPALVDFASGTRSLEGFIYRPSGHGPFPAIVFNHGSEPLPGPKPGQAAFYVPHGYVLFVPHRRGQGRSSGAGADINTKGGDREAFVAELVAQTDDVMAGVRFVAAQSFVDPRRVAVAGCSLGGIESLFAAERGTGIFAAIDFAGGAMMWATSPPLQARMKEAARGARVPVFFLQAANDFDTAPTRVLGAQMRADGKPVRARVFPANGATAEEGHAFCIGGGNPPWGDDVLAFLDAAMPR